MEILKYSFILSTLFQVFISSTALGQFADPDQLTFRRIGVTEGLSQSWATAINQDSQGFIWIGSRDGLNRYDARNFKIYRSDDLDSTTLNSSHVNCIFIDSQERMWVGTTTGINLYNPDLDNFRRIALSKGQDSSNEILISNIVEDGEGRIWATAYDALYAIDPENLKDIRVIITPEEMAGYGKIKGLFFDSQKRLWIGVENGMICLDLNKDKSRIIQSIVKLPVPEGKESLGTVNDIIEYPAGTFLLATEMGGLLRYNTVTMEIDHFTEGKDGLVSNHVRKLMLDDEKGTVWIGTRNGLNIFDLSQQTFSRYQHIIGDPSSLSDNSIHAIFKDKDDSYWLGTYNRGVNIFSDSFFRIKTYKAEKGNRGLSNATVSAINEIEPGQILVGTEGGGINHYNSNTGEYSHYLHKDQDPGSLPHNNVKCIFRATDNIFWIGTSGGGVRTFDPSNGTFSRYHESEAGIGSEGVWAYSIDEDQNGVLWFGLFDDGLLWLDKKTGEHGKFTTTSNPHFSIDAIRKVLVDSKNRVWIGTDNGLAFYDQQTKAFTFFLKEAGNDLALTSNVIYSIYEDSNKNIWIGTLEGGLNRYDEVSRSFDHFMVKDGLPGNNIFGILEDNEKNLWLSTNHGISKFNPQSVRFKNYTIQDGFIDMEYGYNAYFKSASGELFFGGRNGLVSFYPEDIVENTDIPPVVITDIKLFNKPVDVGDESGILNHQISKTDHIVLDHTQNVFSLGFSVLNYVKSPKNQFAYRLEGFKDDWNYVEVPSATYTNLKAGEYTFLVKGANNDGYWNPVPSKLKITVKPAPWKTIWAFMAYFIVISAALFVLVWYQRVKVALEHDLKTGALENKRQKELTQAKLKFFTDISHEIRTPLTLMLTPIEDMITQYKGEPKLHNQLVLIKNNADRLLRLINQLLDFRKRESREVKLKASANDLIHFLKQIVSAFTAEAARRGILFDFATDTEDIRLYYDRDEMEKVFFNLISNAFKYTPDNENITITVTSKEMVTLKGTEPREMVKIEVKDSGIGINTKDIENIFQRYYEADHSGMNSLSTGIGLSLSKSIIKAHKGIIACVSSKDQETGKNCTIFRVYLPYGKEHFSTNDLIEDFRDSEQIGQYQEMLSPLRGEDQFDTDQDDIPEQSGLTLLIAEDNDEIRSFLVNHLSHLYQIKEARNGNEALEIAYKTVPDLVISDVVMPEMDGIQLCIELKNDERTSHVPVIMLTARTSLIHKMEGIETGADDYIVKPFNLAILRAKIRALIKSREYLRKKYSREVILMPENIIIDSKEEKFLNKLKDIIEKNIVNPDFNVNFFIKEIGMSRPVLYRKIKAITNMSIFDFINAYRLNKAAILLKTNQFTVSEIAFEVGFSDPKYFSKAFRKKFGKSPSEYILEADENKQESIDNES